MSTATPFGHPAADGLTLADFIRENIPQILAEWEAFAVTLQPAAGTMTALALRDHAKEILLAMARDIGSAAEREAASEQVERMGAGAFSARKRPPQPTARCGTWSDSTCAS